jgi:2-C-methyl-D-erythritol 2,4-cyclodiphosphate synthase
VLGLHSFRCSVVNIKAKTHEKVDSLGENRSIACHAVVMLLKQ